MDFIKHAPRATFTMDCDGYVTAQHTTQIAALHDIRAHYLPELSTDPADRVPGSWCIADGVADANFVFLHRADDSGITVVDICPHAAGPRVRTLDAARVAVSTTDRVAIPFLLLSPT